MMKLEEIESEWLKGCDHEEGSRLHPELCSGCKKKYEFAKSELARKKDPEGFERAEKKKRLELNGLVGENGKCPKCESQYIGVRRLGRKRTDVDRFGNKTRWTLQDSVSLVCLDCGFEGDPVVPEMYNEPHGDELTLLQAAFKGGEK
ncbi:hypothetical protein [Pseudomonas sp. S9]|uniref:hypothetical protein n=1 Tax=Pseudomonas sp. S9 TaxID=686578 RepID=UPI0002556DEA|nr:hypothetical protein [Pseudomonas sp. S9]